MLKRWLLIVAVGVLAACASQPQSAPTATIEFTFMNDEPYRMPTPTHPGELNYNRYCAHCHGDNGEGQLEEAVENTLRLGMKTVPAHDETGHTWQHPDELLVQVILEGIDNPLNQYPMTGWGHVLTEEDALEIIDYMRQWWTDEQIAHQADVTERWNRRYEDLD